MTSELGTPVRTDQKVVGYIILTFRVYPQDNQYVSECLELGTTSCGDTIDEALKNIREATSLYVNAIERNGERERIFRKRNIPIYLGHPDEGRTVMAREEDTVTITVLPLLSAAPGGRGKASPVF